MCEYENNIVFRMAIKKIEPPVTVPVEIILEVTQLYVSVVAADGFKFGFSECIAP
jgi:hypothetical protein